MADRVVALIDGFNLYHALKETREAHHKWLNLWTLCSDLRPGSCDPLAAVYYFSAFATWEPDAYRRHRVYLKALEAVGVTPVMGRFKIKDRHCKLCNRDYQGHEEKQTDVNVALYLYRLAARDAFDAALLISNDSDLVPAVRMVRQDFPKKRVIVVAPPIRRQANELIEAVGGKENCRTILPFMLQHHLLDREVKDKNGAVVALRPSEWDPPTAPGSPLPVSTIGVGTSGGPGPSLPLRPKSN
jgi:uncharacterized LabA/DUF88 family protein